MFHIPNDMTNQDLYNYFATFGNVISARIMVERTSGRSRGFGIVVYRLLLYDMFLGFVSYDNSAAADAAITGMNGFQVGKKRLKVQHKKDKLMSDDKSPKKMHFQQRNQQHALKQVV